MRNRKAIAGAVVFVGALVAPCLAQPTIDERRVAATGSNASPTFPVWEPELATSPSRIVAVFNYGNRGGISSWTGYAYATASGGAWAWTNPNPERVPRDPFGDATGNRDKTIDPSIAYDTTSGTGIPTTFLICALVIDQGGTPTLHTHRIAVCLYQPGEADEFGDWQTLYSGQAGADQLDKPFIIADEVMNGDQECYVVFIDKDVGAVGYRYLRSIDGGASWLGGVVTVSGSAVSGTFCAQPAVTADGQLLIAYTESNSPPTLGF